MLGHTTQLRRWARLLGERSSNSFGLVMDSSAQSPRDLPGLEPSYRLIVALLEELRERLLLAAGRPNVVVVDPCRCDVVMDLSRHD